MMNLLLFIGTYASTSFLSLWRYPFFAFILYQTVYFFFPSGRWWSYMLPGLPFSMLSVLLMMAVLVLNRAETFKQPAFKVPSFKWFYVLVFLYFITYFYAAMPDIHIEFAINYVKLAVIMTVAYKLCNSEKALNGALYAYIFGAWYVGFLAYQVGRGADGRLQNVYLVDAPDVNFVAAAIAPSLIFCLYFFWIQKSNVKRGLVSIAGAFVANAIVLCNSRGAYLAVVGGAAYFMFFMFFSSFQRKYQKLTAIFVIVAGVGALAVVMDESSIKRVLTIADNTEVVEERETAATRTQFWVAAIDMAKDYPLGGGYEAFTFRSAFYIPENIATGGSRSRAVHSSWFETLSEVGYLGLYIYLMMIITSFLTARKTKKYLREHKMVDEYFKIIAMEGALLSYMIAMTFINRMRAEVFHWLLLFIWIAYNVYVLQQKKPKKIEEEQPAEGAKQGKLNGQV